MQNNCESEPCHSIHTVDTTVIRADVKIKLEKITKAQAAIPQLFHKYYLMAKEKLPALSKYLIYELDADFVEYTANKFGYWYGVVLYGPSLSSLRFSVASTINFIWLWRPLGHGVKKHN